MLSTDLIGQLERLTVTQGRRAGERFTVLPWQRRFLRGAFGDGVQTAALSISRGNGKTAFLAGVAVMSLIGALRVPRGETILVASSFEQSRIAFEHVLSYMRPVLNADKSKRWRTWDTSQQSRLEDRLTGARVRCIGSDPRRAHGLAPTLVLADEPAQWAPNTAEAMVAALETSAGKQPHSRFIALGTRPVGEEHWFSRLLAGSADYAQTHAAEATDPPFQRRTWAKANPSLKHMPDLLDAIKREAKRAHTDPSVLAAFRALRLNLGTADTVESVLLDATVWQDMEAHEVDAQGAYVLGLDLGTSGAQSAASAYFMATGALDTFAVFPEIPTLAERGLSDGVGALYTRCAERGELLTAGEYVSDVRALLAESLRRWGRPVAITCDRWREAELREHLGAINFPLASLVVRGMGYKDGADDVRRFRAACLDGQVHPRRSLLLRSAMAQARVVTDTAGNAKLAKGVEGGRRLRARDDAVAAAILAVAEGSRMPVAQRPRWRYRGTA